MAQYKSDFLNVLEQRGMIHQISDAEALDKKLSEGMVTAYCGYDATAKSLHIGNLMSIIMLHWFQECGHRPLTLMGGATTMLGDPTGKDELRQMKTLDEINGNIASIKTAFDSFLTYGDSGNGAQMVNNADWMLEFKYIDFLRDYGRHFSVNRMLTMDSVKLRLEREQPLSFLEFNYMILQAYDFVELNKRFGTSLQLGGSDQWGNMVGGIDLGRRISGAELFVLTCPLLTKANGEKMGKSVGGAIWLNGDMLSPYDYYQFWRNCDDADLSKLIRIFTKLPMDEITKIDALEGAEMNEGKKILAYEATKWLHGQAAADDAAETARKTFEQGSVGADLPRVEVKLAQLQGEGVTVLQAFQDTGLASSGGEVKRLIKGGGARVNDKSLSDMGYVLSAADVTEDGYIKLSSGKKRHALLVAV
ncbi:MAG: tyrosine--tRNA ligase [Alphaproteobacteria bacterium]|nr:tyrosine--tRNA ligase [Alphaproteobacteria bacterium]|tara:strand:- start:622637 stop:623893 length:1257 start_codon:yes stop_codon:yes gene_type:complete